MGRLGRVGPYTLLERLGRGGMGEVYLASGRRGDSVALKVLHDMVDADFEARIRLEREVRALRRVESPYVARVVDADLEGERPYLVMQYIEGETLLERVRRAGPVEGGGLLTLAHGLATALSIIHAAGVVHRDLKPANVLVGEDDEPVLIDFGIAHVLDATRLTLTGTFLGTPGYAAPELFADEPVGEPADVHAWAATVAFAATGRPTFGRGTVEAQMYAILNGQADLEGVPAALLPLIRAALHREPAKRPTAAQLCGRLGRLVRVAPEASRRPGPAAGKQGARAGARGDAAGSDRPPPGTGETARAGRGQAPESARTGRGSVSEAPRTGRGSVSDAPRAGRGAVSETSRSGRSAAAESARAERAATAEGARPGRRTPGGTGTVRRGPVRNRPDKAAGEPGARSGSGPLPAGNASLLLLAVLAVPCVVATVLWPVATFAVTALFTTLARTLWVGHRLVRRRRSARARAALRVAGFPFVLAGSLLTALVWPGLPAAALAGAALWLTFGGSLPPHWWEVPAPVALAGVVFGVVCGGVLGREIERIGAELVELRKEGLRALAVLGGFVALCSAAVQAIALLV
ncbi:serine/threonine-protein kinase [Streptosporangium sp. NPDC050855]|uniref:serine/threonine-protein kinase n=1 Tax=Streptosporangium sp. NPDC050855 TaxID=3366194 RepID=UPI0037A2E417